MIKPHIYRVAADFIRRGFCKEFYGKMKSKPGEHIFESKDLPRCDSFCAMGALKAACYVHNVSISYYAHFILKYCFEKYGLTLVQYNDHPQTTQGDIIQLFNDFADTIV